MKQIIYNRKALKTLRKMDGVTAERIVGKIETLARTPQALANNIRALKGAEGLMRLRVGDWRIIYAENGTVLAIMRIAPRGSAYE